MIGRYMKRPVAIDAVKWTGANVRDVIELGCVDMQVCGTQIRILTPEGGLLVKPGYFIIKGINGEFYPCPKDIFEKTYDRV